MICERGRYNIPFDVLGIKKEQMIILSVTGSKLFGTATESSDTDFCGVYIPTMNQMKLGEFPYHIGLPKEYGLDLQIWSIQYYLKLACDGDTMALDLLHAPYINWICYNPDAWKVLTDIKTQFYTKGMSSYMGFARDQATKYGIKGDRLNTLRKVLDFFDTIQDQTIKLKEIWYSLPTGSHIHHLDDVEPFRLYQVCGKKYQETVKIAYMKKNLEKNLQEYGKRAIAAAKNEGIDWKGLSHALRSCEQIQSIMETGTYSFPLRNWKFITAVKKGKIEFKMVEAVLSDWVDLVEDLTQKSELPEFTTVNKEELILKIVNKFAIDE